MSHPNLHVNLRIPGASRFVTLFGNFMDSLQRNGTPTAVAATAQTRGWDILNASFRGNLTALRIEYWSSINKQVAPAPPSPTFAPPGPGSTNNNTAPSGSDPQAQRTLIVTLCVVLPVFAALTLGIILWRTRATKAGRGSGGVKPPGAGPRTTLLVSDIEE